MTDEDAIHQRGRVLEDLYFRAVDEELLRDMRQKSSHAEMVQELTKATGLENQELIDQIIDAGFSLSTLAALSLTPLVFVAWADGSVTSDERQTVIAAALRQGVYQNPLAFKMVEQWLQTRPSRELWQIWRDYAAAMHETLPAVTADKFAALLKRNAIAVAQASGGTLGFGKISSAEQKVIDEIVETLPAHAN